MGITQNKRIDMELKVTLNCGIPVDFTGKLDEPYNFIGTFSDMLAKYRTSENYEIKNSAMIEIELRAIRYAHKALSGYIKRVAMADEAVRLLMSQLYNITNQNKQLCKK